MKQVLVTGVNGFVGQHLAKELSENGITVIGVGGAQGAHKDSPYLSKYIELDLSQAAETANIDFSEVDGVIHLAGLAAVGPSFDDPMRYITTNAAIESNLLETALKQTATPRFLVISTGALYDAKATLPLSETSPLLASSPYAVSKITQEQLAQYYGLRGFEIIVARPFNHIGPGQNPGFIVPDIAQQIIACETGQQTSIKVGNLDAERDYTDVRDIARAYRLLLEKGVPGETYNVCSGRALSGHDILQGLLDASGSSIQTESDPNKMRPSDNPTIFGSDQKITDATGWQPTISIDQTLADVIADWRARKS